MHLGESRFDSTFETSSDDNGMVLGFAIQSDIDHLPDRVVQARFIFALQQAGVSGTSTFAEISRFLAESMERYNIDVNLGHVQGHSMGICTLPLKR
jgi:hypothetical protein